MAARYEEDVFGTTKIGFKSVPFAPGRLGSGVVPLDFPAFSKELASNEARIEGWRRTKSYHYFIAVCSVTLRQRPAEFVNQDFQASVEASSFRGIVSRIQPSHTVSKIPGPSASEAE